MGKRVISFGLSEKEIDRALRELADYKQEIIQKAELLRDKVAERLAEEAKTGFNGAVVDDLVKGGQKFAQVDVSVDSRGSVTVVVASGEDAVWVEFGAGAYHNGSPGSSPHPNGAELGMTIGGFGKGNGKKKVWGYYEDGELKLTRGTPARMPMARAVTTVCNDIKEIAKEVFG
nr:MAG TPA: tail component protein [Caudoviricetes sp.]